VLIIRRVSCINTVYVTVCRWPALCIPHSDIHHRSYWYTLLHNHLHRVTYSRGRIDTIYVGDRAVCIPHGHLHTVTYTRGPIDALYVGDRAVCKRHGHLHTVTYTRGRIGTLYVGDRAVCITHGHLHTVTYTVLIQLTLLMISTWLLETCRELD